MISKHLNYIVCFLGMLLLPGMLGWAQRSSDEPEKVNFVAIVWAEAEKNQVKWVAPLFPSRTYRSV